MKLMASLLRMTWTQSHSRTLSFLHSNSHWQWGQIFVIVTALHRTILLQYFAARAVGEPMKWDIWQTTFSPKAAKSVSQWQVFWLIPAPETFPSFPDLAIGFAGQWCNIQKPQAELMAGTYSSGNCCRLSRHSLLILPGVTGINETNERCKCKEILLKTGEKSLNKMLLIFKSLICFSQLILDGRDLMVGWFLFWIMTFQFSIKHKPD